MENKMLNLKEIQNIEFSILKIFSLFCRENNLNYSLTYGTLIGAIRHHGFIPWDDDIDVMMPRADYNIFIELFQSSKYAEKLSLYTPNNMNDYYYPFAKLCDSRTVAKSQSGVTIQGVWIDIFPVDKIHENYRIAQNFQKKMIFLRRMVVSYDTDFIHRKFDKKTLPKFILSIIGKAIGKRKITQYMEREAQKYNHTNTKNVCHLVWQAATGGIMTEDEFEDLIKVPFEQSEFYVIRTYDKFLRSLYGDYMMIPPENKRATHNLIAYYK